MFFLRVHSVDTDHPLATDYGGFSSSSPSPSPKFTERRGMVHLFRTLSHAPLSSPGSRSTTLFVVAVPNYFSPDDFIRFCGPRIDDVSELRFIRNDGMEDRYSVLVELVDQKTADGFYCTFNGKNFSPAEAEVCHILFMHEVDYTESADVASTPPSGFTELPSCPVCLERLDPDTSGILSTQCDHSFHCSCGTKWTYLSCQVCRLCQQQDEVPACFICGTMENLWVCLICGFVGCGRYKDKHAISHWKNTQHCYSLDLRTQQIWDYVGDTYVHRLNQSKADGKLLEMNSYCESLEGDCGSCGYSEDSEISGALFSSKIEAIHADYIHLASTQLEVQRKHYESLMLEAKSRKENSKLEAIEKAVTSKIQDVHSELEKLGDEKKAVAELNQTLIKNQDMMRRKVKEIEERIHVLLCICRKALSLKSKDEQILDLEEQYVPRHSSQIRDLKVYIGAQKTLDETNDKDGVKGGTLLPVPLQQSTPARKSGKPSRRRK
ncbi:BRAP2 RING ZnF UBP domain-containing protein 1 isoform X2 [Rhodamnia argentea]|uniref:BRAP2 RING ZnF UBP domain-containing protein 1 isoform X2 n=1 Tax=Rhodamnia argentea TaxID=178133 RepID=A0ABM3H8T4_9MYRT|nr:BRAP2 RING ZnF UBP domain-containing protein 1 isoform X2 [Rhodamnia argentea]